MYRIGDYTSTNVLGTALLLDVLANDYHRVTKLVLASSRSVYGEGAYQCPRCGLVYPPACAVSKACRRASGSRPAPAVAAPFAR